MHACIHKASGFIGGKGPRPLKIVILPDKGQSVNLGINCNCKLPQAIVCCLQICKFVL